MKQFCNSLILSALFIFLSQTIFAAGLSGTYTIDNSGKGSPNYTSFRAAVNDLSLNGVSGAVVFKVADGIYNESITLGKVNGASAANTITFQSNSLDSSKVLLDTSFRGNSPDYGHTIWLLNASYITFREMSIINANDTLANAIQYSSGCSHLNFENCIIKTDASTNNYGYCVYDSEGTDNNITFINNIIRGGEVSFYGLGGALAIGGTKEKALTLSHNIIDSAWYDGVLLYSVDSLTMIGNRISSITFTLSVSNSFITVKDSSIIANNFITSNGWGVWLNITDKLKFYYNSVYTNTGTSYYYAAGFNNGYVTTTANNFVMNNIFVSTGKSPAVYMTYSAAKKCDYNDIYSTSGTIATWNNTSTSTKTNCSSLKSWQTTSKFDKNGISADPKFNSVSTGDLHLTTGSVAVLHKGIPLREISDDIDRSVRGNSPSIGADDIFQYHTDAAILSIDSPQLGFCAGTRDIYANLFNAGIDSLKSVTINWSLDGVTQTSISWTGALGIFGSSEIKLGTKTFTSGSVKTIKVWTSNPNGVADSNANNDTVQNSVSPGLSGTNTIGGVGGTTFSTAARTLNTYGVCGAVVFNVYDGNYNEKVLLGVIPGSSATNTVTFQSKSLDSTKVKLYYPYPSPYYFPYESYIVRFNGTQYVSFRKMTIVNSDTTNSTANVVVLDKDANHITIENNIIYTTPVFETGAEILSDPNSSESHISILNNHITGGNYAVYMGGDVSILGPNEYSNVIMGNIIDSTNLVTLYLQFQDSMQIIGNKMTNIGASGVGIYMYDFNSKNVTRIINNFMTCTGSGTYALYSESVPSLTLAYNSMVTTGACWYTAYFNGFNAKASLNNNIFWASSGIAFSGTSGSISSSDYNDFYANGYGTLATWLSGCATLTDLQKTSGMDKHSVTVDALFVDPNNGDLHLTDSSTLRGKATPLKGILTDVDGEKRNTKTPDIGADEFVRDSFDVGATTIISPSSSTCGNTSTNITVKVKVTNYGVADESGFRVHARINKTDTASIAFTKSIIGNRGAFPKDTTVSIPFTKTWNTTAGAVFNIDAYTSLVNDSNLSNDTTHSTYTINALPVVKFGYVKACLNDTVQFLDSSTAAASITSHSWTFGNKLNSALTSPKTIYASVGKYDVQLKVKDANGCIDSFSKTVSIDSLLNAKFTYVQPVNLSTYYFTASDSNLKSYSWDFGDTTSYGSGKTTSHSYAYAFVTHYATLTVTNSSGCSNYWTDKLSYLFNSIQNQTSNNTISFYPNPASDKLYIEASLARASARAYITDMTGKVLLSQMIISKETMIDISHLAKGMYMLRYDGNVVKFVKE